MKKKLYISITLLCLSMVSCTEFLDTKPEDFSKQEDYYNSQSKLISAIGSVYFPLASQYANALIIHLAPADDEYFGNLADPISIFTYDNTEANIGGLWRACYQGIERANVLIANINVATDISAADRQAILGEALFLRGYYYFMLVSGFGDVPLKLTPTESAEVQIARTPAVQVYAQILADMQAAETKVKSIDQLGYGGRVSKTVVQGILARVNLQMAGYPLYIESGYTDALKWATKVKNSGIHSLNPSYQQVFINLIQDKYDIKESMWEMEFMGNGLDGTGNTNRQGSTSGIATPSVAFGYSLGNIKASPILFNLFQGGDKRRDWAIAPFSYITSGNTVTKSYYPSTELYIREQGKYRREYELTPVKGQNNTPINFPVLRYADVLLMLAEAENHVNGPTALAYDCINQVRRRGFGFAANTPTTSTTAISGLTLATTAGTNTGYTASVNTIPLYVTGGGGTGAIMEATVVANKIATVGIVNPGTGYTSAPVVEASLAWAPLTNYVAGTQVHNGANLYTVATSGISSATPPIHTAGTVLGFTYAGKKAIITASVSTTAVDLTGLTQATFFKAIQDERSRELCFECLRKFDLIRWGIWVEAMNGLGNYITNNAPANRQTYGTAGRNVTTRHLLYPIPSVETTVNKLATQNPGW